MTPTSIYTQYLEDDALKSWLDQLYTTIAAVSDQIKRVASKPASRTAKVTKKLKLTYAVPLSFESMHGEAICSGDQEHLVPV